MDSNWKESGGARTPRQWPDWAEPLYPDTATIGRLRRSVAVAVDSVLERRTRSSLGVAIGWASVVGPIAAAIAIVFGVLAYRAGAAGDPAFARAGPAATQSPSWASSSNDQELLFMLAPEAEAPPDLLLTSERPSPDEVLAATFIAW